MTRTTSATEITCTKSGGVVAIPMPSARMKFPEITIGFGTSRYPSTFQRRRRMTMLDDTVRFIVFPDGDGQYGARADVVDHPYAHLSAFADTPQEALRELVEVVIPGWHEIIAEMRAGSE